MPEQNSNATANSSPSEYSESKDHNVVVTYKSAVEAFTEYLGEFNILSELEGCIQGWCKDREGVRQRLQQQLSGSDKPDELLSFIGSFYNNWWQLKLEVIRGFLKEYLPDEADRILEPLTKDKERPVFTVYERMMEIRATRGPFIRTWEPPEQTPAANTSNAAINLSELELYATTLAFCKVLCWLEELYYKKSAFPWEVYAYVVNRLINERKLHTSIDTWLPTSKVVENGKTDGFKELITERWGKDERCFFDTYNRLIEAHGELFPVFAAEFINEHFERYSDGRTLAQVRRVLKALQDKLTERFNVQSRYASGEFRADYLKNIDESIAGIYETLKHYGITATTYPEARDEAERLYKETQPPPKLDKQPTIEERVRRIQEEAEADVLTLAGLYELKEKLKKQFPDRERFIDFEMNKIINDYRRRKA
jgi:hypothetical protein